MAPLSPLKKKKASHSSFGIQTRRWAASVPRARLHEGIGPEGKRRAIGRESGRRTQPWARSRRPVRRLAEVQTPLGSRERDDGRCDCLTLARSLALSPSIDDNGLSVGTNERISTRNNSFRRRRPSSVIAASASPEHFRPKSLWGISCRF